LSLIEQRPDNAPPPNPKFPEPSVPLSKELIESAAATVRLPESSTPLAGALVWTATLGADATVKLSLPEGTKAEHRAQIAAELEIAIRRAAMDADEDLESLFVQFVNHAGEIIDQAGEPNNAIKQYLSKPTAGGAGGQPTRPPTQPPTAAATPQDQSNPLPGVKHVIAVGAGKGGVGKSTVAVNLAVCLARQGHAVGILDGDIYGPSLPTLLNLGPIEQVTLAGQLQPFAVYGVKAITIGKMVDTEKPLIWRGPMAHGAFTQLITRTDWGTLDYLIVDLPPGTGDVPLSLAQSLSCTGAVIVCTPQKVAQDDAVRASGMFKQLGVEVLGVVENMSYFVADPDEHGVAKTYDIFGRGGAEQMAQRLGLPFLGAIPINMALRLNSDRGDPTRNLNPETAGGDELPAALNEITAQLQAQVALASMKQGTARPTLNIS
jgi:ATP-binding protein involved in chromosome partitioning